MFVCKTCIHKFEGPTVERVLADEKRFGKFGQSFGVCEFCYQVDGCFDLYSGDSGWYPKKENEDG